MEKNTYKIVKLAIIIILLIYAIVVASTAIVKYHVSPIESYKVDPQNFVDDGSFENFNQLAGDCCNSNPNASKVYAIQSADAYKGQYSLKLYSENQCACINKEIVNFSKEEQYLISFYYKGDNAKVCIYSQKTGSCLKSITFEPPLNWSLYRAMFTSKNNSEISSVYFYTASSGELKINYYDDLQVKKLIPMTKDEQFKDNVDYVIRTNPENKVNGEKLSDEGWFIVHGKPSITLKIPYTEIIIILIIMIIVARLILKIDKKEW